jgi:DNA-binding transcriptional ArsR family regulator
MDENEAPPLRNVDLESLKVLAHPLRVQILDTLSTYGAFTASGLADRLGESSGATSYHLRQLAKHDFVREVEGKGTTRERWWERTPGGINLDGNTSKTPAGKAATELILREWSNSREQALRAFIDNADELPEQWTEASTVAILNVQPTAEQLAEFTKAYFELANEFARKYRHQTVAGSRPVQVQFNAFPVIDGNEIPGEGGN